MRLKDILFLATVLVTGTQIAAHDYDTDDLYFFGRNLEDEHYESFAKRDFREDLAVRDLDDQDLLDIVQARAVLSEGPSPLHKRFLCDTCRKTLSQCPFRGQHPKRPAPPRPPRPGPAPGGAQWI